MITLKDLDCAEKILQEGYALDYYSPKKNKLAYKLCGMNPVERSDKLEAIVFSILKKKGYNVYRMGGLKKRYDLWANDERIEVKSSLAERCVTRKGDEYYTYTFPGVKPECFDRLVLVYVTPTGVELSILTKRAVYARIRSGNLKRGAQGYSIYQGKGSKTIGRKFSNFLELTNR